MQRRLDAPRHKQSLSTFLRKAVNLSPPAIGLLHEAIAATPGRFAEMDAADLAALINAVPVRLVGTAPLDARHLDRRRRFVRRDRRALSCCAARPGVFVAGEMLDWEAPTGGYLLQASFATGVAAARGALAWLARDKKPG